MKFIALLLLSVQTAAAVTVGELQCEHRRDPLGVDVSQPRLSWILDSGRQTAYQIVVDGAWDSGWVASDQSVNVTYGGKPLAPGTHYAWKIRVRDAAGEPSEWSRPASFTTGLHDWQAKWIAAPTPAASLVLRREFAAKPKLRRATAFVCGLGQYELTVNGRKAGDDLLAPGWTKYDKTCLYDTYDVTALLAEGANTVSLLLGNGMYNVTGGRYTKFTGTFGALKAISEWHLEYADGTAAVIGTDDRWQSSPGPITFSCVFGGEDYDARWQPKWSPAAVVKGPGGQLKGISCAAPPIRAFNVFNPVHNQDVKPGVRVYDLGQNAAIMPRITATGPAGSTVKITPSELVKASGEIDDTMCGGRCYWTYTLAGQGAETWMPKFSYRGGRYLQVQASGGAAVQSVAGVAVHSAAQPAGEFACSNDLFNRIHTLVLWAQRSNMVSVLTDCPHREKLGWLEQYHLNGPACATSSTWRRSLPRA